MLDVTTIAGALVAGTGGLIMGSSVWPYKLMRKYQFEHWWFVSGVVGLLVMPWTITLLGCPHAIDGIRGIPVRALLLGNLFSLGWGVANVLCGLCFLRIGVALTGAVLGGLGASLGTIAPMIFKGSGQFKDAPDPTSPAGLTVLVGVGVLVTGVICASIAGFGRDRILKGQQRTSGSFLVGLTMAVVSGILSAFMGFSFVYSQGPIKAHMSYIEPGQRIEVRIADDEKQHLVIASDGSIELKNVGAVSVGGMCAADAAERIAQVIQRSRPIDIEQVEVTTGSIPATFAVFALAVLAGTAVNLVYAVNRLNRNRSWHVITTSRKEFLLAVVIGVNFSVAVTMMGVGMLLLGVLGASIGIGIQQAMQMIGGQGLGFVSGEWRGVQGRPRLQMYLAITLLLVAGVILAYGNTLAKGQ
jgi:hypothetical protein